MLKKYKLMGSSHRFKIIPSMLYAREGSTLLLIVGRFERGWPTLKKKSSPRRSHEDRIVPAYYRSTSLSSCVANVARDYNSLVCIHLLYTHGEFLTRYYNAWPIVAYIKYGKGRFACIFFKLEFQFFFRWEPSINSLLSKTVIIYYLLRLEQ